MEQITAIPDEYCPNCGGLIFGNPLTITPLCQCNGVTMAIKIQPQSNHRIESLIIIKEARTDVMALVLEAINEYFQDDETEVKIRNTPEGMYEVLTLKKAPGAESTES